MDQEYEYHYTDFAYILVSRIVEQARMDLTLPLRCEGTDIGHRASKCAREFLDWLGDYRVKYPLADHIDIALEILER